MQLKTTRFGGLVIEREDVLVFPGGLIGMEECRDWVLLADGFNAAVAWLQCLTQPALALAVVSPRRFVPQYQLRLAAGELAPLQLDSVRSAQVLAIVASGSEGLTLNLKAPLVLNLDLRLGRQVVNNLDEPIAWSLTRRAALMRKSA